MDSRLKSHAFSIFTLVVLALAFLIDGALAQGGPRILVSIPGLRIAPKERIVGFELHVKAGRIASLPKVPIGWNLSIGNDPSWNTNLEGTVIVGAAAIESSFFKDFLTIEKSELPRVAFDLTGEITVTEDFEAMRKVKIGMKDFAIREISDAQKPRPGL